MVFHCRCLSFSFEEEEEEEEEIEYETTSQVQSTSTQTQTFYTASSNFNPSITDSRANSSLLSINLQAFTYSELKEATKNFSRSAKIGRGGFGSVYMGVINDPRDSTKRLDVAVKQLGRRGFQGHKEWVTEVNVLGVVEHPNLVKLVGHCAEEDEKGIQRLLVYEYMPNRSVDDHLSTTSEAPLSWSMRLKVAHDAARGLTYLHEEMHFQIIFRDFKSSNILLDDQWNAKLSDFGLARLGPGEGLTHVTTAVVGTIGYMAPEYIKTGHLTAKSDVWSYGVFLYELITGRRPVDINRPKNEQKLLEWVRPYLKSKKFLRIIDPRLLEAGNFSPRPVLELAIIANRCLCRYPKSRPKMSVVLAMVNQLITGVPSPLVGLVSVVAIDPNMVSTNNMEDEVQPKQSACFSRICCVS